VCQQRCRTQINATSCVLLAAFFDRDIFDECLFSEEPATLRAPLPARRVSLGRLGEHCRKQLSKGYRRMI
jgi:hypothetical protein